MRILLSSFWLYPNTGAIDRYIRKLQGHLEGDGHIVDIVARGETWDELRIFPGNPTEKPRAVNLRDMWPMFVPALWGQFGSRYELPTNWVMEREGEQYAYEIGLLRLCCPWRYDLVHAHDIHACRAISRIMPKGVPLVLTTHGLLAYEWLAEHRIPAGDSLEWRYSRIRETTGIKTSDITVVPSEWMRREYARHFGVSDEHMVVVPYGLDENEFINGVIEDTSALPNLTGKTVVTSVARLVPLKGHETLFRALKILGTEFPEVCCLLVGDGPRETELRHMVSDLGLGSTVTFLGRRDDVPGILALTDFLVLTSSQEVTPVAITEAQLAGVPVIATDVGGISELVVHGHSGLLVPPADPEALAQAMRVLLEDRDHRAQLGKQGQATALTERTWRTHYGRLMSMYDRVFSTKNQFLKT